MARARNIKPGFFSNELLAEIPPLGRLLFAGLWTIADREGRLEDRPAKIKAALLPYDECSADDYLSALADRNFIVRYETGGRRFLHIVNWEKHQNPHVKEQPSIIPAPCKPGACPVQAPDTCGVGPEIAQGIPVLIPGSLDSLIPREEGGSASSGARAPSPRQLLEAWNANRGGLAEAKALSGGRERAARARLKSMPDIHRWGAAVCRLAALPHIVDKPWATIDFLLRPDSLTKIEEGRYDQPFSDAVTPGRGGGGRTAGPRNRTAAAGMHLAPQPPPRETAESPPRWIEAIERADLSPLRPVIPEGLDEARERWYRDPSTPAPDGWEESLQAAILEAEEYDRPRRVAACR